MYKKLSLLCMLLTIFQTINSSQELYDLHNHLTKNDAVIEKSTTEPSANSTIFTWKNAALATTIITMSALGFGLGYMYAYDKNMPEFIPAVAGGINTPVLPLPIDTMISTSEQQPFIKQINTLSEQPDAGIQTDAAPIQPESIENSAIIPAEPLHPLSTTQVASNDQLDTSDAQPLHADTVMLPEQAQPAQPQTRFEQSRERFNAHIAKKNNTPQDDATENPIIYNTSDEGLTTNANATAGDRNVLPYIPYLIPVGSALATAKLGANMGVKFGAALPSTKNAIQAIRTYGKDALTRDKVALVRNVLGSATVGAAAGGYVGYQGGQELENYIYNDPNVQSTETATA